MLTAYVQTGAQTPDGPRFDPPTPLTVSTVADLYREAAEHCRLNDCQVVQHDVRDAEVRFMFSDGFFMRFMFPPVKRAPLQA